MASSKANIPAIAAPRTILCRQHEGGGHIYQQTFIDTYAKVGFAKLYDRKTPITATDLLNDRVLPFFDSHEIKLLRVLTDRGSEYCGNPERHEYELHLAVEDIDHSRTKTKSPQTNGICERFHKTLLNEFYRVAFRKSCTVRPTSCRSISICGSATTTKSAPIKADGASERPRISLSACEFDSPAAMTSSSASDSRSQSRMYPIYDCPRLATYRGREH
jgi:transposase InsO family protein